VGNPKPRFAIEHARLGEIKQIGSKKDHLKILFKDSGATLDGVAFRKGDLFHHIEPEANVSVVGELAINEWNGFRKPQLMIEDIKIDSWQFFDWRKFRHIDQYLEQLPLDKSLFVYFQENAMEAFPKRDIIKDFYHCDDINEQHADGHPYLVLVDMPESEEQIERLFQKLPFPERIYTIFYHEEERFFSSIPDREHFKKSYVYLLQKKSVSVSQAIQELSAHYKWRPELTHFTFKVFSELEFVKIEDGRITVVDEPQKKPIQSSKLYQRLQSQVKLEEALTLSSRQSLKQWFNRYLHLQNEPEEATVR